MKWFRKIIRSIASTHWAIGFVKGGLPSIMDGVNSEESSVQVDWVKMPKDRWFADPFVLDVTETEIQLLVEDMPYDVEDYKGRISLLHINRSTMEIASRKVLLDLPTHLSFPAIWRKDGHIYVYPESAHSGRLDLYEYHPETETLSFVQTICDDVVWDSYITEAFGEPLLFTAAHNDEQLDIYRWDNDNERFVPFTVIKSDTPNSRIGGAVFGYNGEYYYPAQDCSKNYGGAIDIKRIEYVNGKFTLSFFQHIVSPHPKYQLGLHTLNVYKGTVVIDVRGYRFGIISQIMFKIANIFLKWKN